MRKIFTLFTMCMLAAVAWAADITFDPAVDKGNSGETASAYQVSKEGVTIDVTNGMVAADKGVWAYRVYKGQTMTITCDNSDITSIVFECAASGEEKYGPGCFTKDKGTYNFNGNVGTWTGSERTVVFTASSNQVRATKITVTVGKAGLAKPVITPAGGSYTDPFDVTMTCSTTGAKIYYTTDGSTPSTGSKLYSAPFRVSSNTTVKAISALDGEVSDVVEAVYEFISATTVQNIKAYQQVADNTVVKFANPVTVTAQSGNRMYVKDNTGYALFYGATGQTYGNGDVIPAGFIGTKITYSGEPELSELSNFQPKSGTATAAAEEMTCSQVNASMFAHYVLIKEAQFDLDGMLIKDASGQAPLYFNMNVKKADVKSGVTYDVYAIIASFGREGEPVVYQVIPVKVEAEMDKVGLGDLGNLPDDQTVKLAYETTVIWQSGNYMYVKDQTGCGLIYGSTGHEYFIGDVLAPGYTAKKTTYPKNAPNEPELATPFTGFGEPVRIDENFPYTAEEITIDQVNHDHWAHYVVLKDVMISEDGNTITRDGKSCTIFNSTFNIPVPTDKSVPHTVYGVVAVYRDYQILPISFDEVPKRPAPVLPIPVNNLQEMYQLTPKTQKGHFIKPLTAIYHNPEARYTYVQDDDGEFGLIYGELTDHNFKNGTLINDAITTWSTYQGAPQLEPKDDSIKPGEMDTPVEPVELPIEEISQDMAHTYFAFEDVNIYMPTGEETRIIMNDGTENVQLFDKFKYMDDQVMQMVTDWSAQGTFDVEGFLGLFNGAMQIFPISIKKHGVPTYDLCDVNLDGEVTVADVNLVIEVILGLNKDADIKQRSDVNKDGEISVADVNKIIARILGN